MSVASLIGTGVTFGAVHVLTGPDHLSALATLSANGETRKAFNLGVRWGLGHSLGLIVVGSILMALSRGEDSIDVPETLSRCLESFVGVFMLFLGAYGLSRAVQKDRRERQIANTNATESDTHTILPGNEETPLHDGAARIQGENSMSSADANVETVRVTSQKDDEFRQLSISTNANDQDESSSPPSRFRRVVSSFSAGFMALMVGIVHGVAGPGGVLGVIPAVQMRNWKLGGVYLLSFCVSSTTVMGCFAGFYGTCSSRFGKEGRVGEVRMEYFSSALSIFVGVLWIVLVATNKLDDIFP